jgi:hypothetical protein
MCGTNLWAYYKCSKGSGDLFILWLNTFVEQQTRLDAFISTQKDKASAQATSMAINHVVKGHI